MKTEIDIKLYSLGIEGEVVQVYIASAWVDTEVPILLVVQSEGLLDADIYLPAV